MSLFYHSGILAGNPALLTRSILDLMITIFGEAKIRELFTVVNCGEEFTISGGGGADIGKFINWIIYFHIGLGYSCRRSSGFDRGGHNGGFLGRCGGRFLAGSGNQRTGFGRWSGFGDSRWWSGFFGKLGADSETETANRTGTDEFVLVTGGGEDNSVIAFGEVVLRERSETLRIAIDRDSDGIGKSRDGELRILSIYFFEG